MTHDIRMAVADARRDAASGRALVACAYDDPGKCGNLGEGALSLDELTARSSGLSPDQEILFVCA